MIKLYSLLGLLFLSLSAAAQCVLTGDVTLSSQQSITDFREANCTCVTATITGKLSIQGSDITDLSLLTFVTEITDSLSIVNNPFLASLDGLNEVTSVGMNFDIISNPLLTNLSGLENVTDVGGMLNIIDNSSLTSLSGFVALKSVGLDLYISTNPNLSHLTGLENLESVGGALVIESNDGLKDLKGLEKLDNITSDVAIVSNNSLTSLSGLGGITTIGGTVTFLSNDVLTDFSGFTNLASIGGGLYILLNPALTSFNGFQSLVSIYEDIIVAANDALLNVNGLNNLLSVNGYILFQQNASLANLTGIEKLTTGITSLGIVMNPSLTSLKGLENLTTILEDVIISGNEILTDISALSKLSDISGLLDISDNTLLQMCAMQPICTFLSNTPENARIENNATGCATVEDVISACTALPVTLISFEVKKILTEKLPASQLLWSTASETNSDHFEVQYSSNAAKNWKILGLVSAKVESTTDVNYSFLHPDPVNGENLYRLKMIDKDGTFAYSRITNISFDKLQNSLTIYPNPVIDQLFIQTNQPELQKMEIFNTSGRKVFDSGKVSLSVNGLVDQLHFNKYLKGLYLIKMTEENGAVTTRKVIKE